MLSAKEAGLRYVSDAQPGIRRKRSGKGFQYVDAEGKPVRNRDILQRIRLLVIPPAWRDVGSARILAGTCRQPAAMRGAASRVGTIRDGA